MFESNAYLIVCSLQNKNPAVAAKLHFSMNPAGDRVVDRPELNRQESRLFGFYETTNHMTKTLFK